MIEALAIAQLAAAGVGLSCEALTSVDIPGGSIASAESIPAGPLPSPETAQYDGSGELADASKWTCAAD